MTLHFYLGSDNLNLDNENWKTLIDEIRQIVGVGDLPAQQLAEVGNNEHIVVGLETYSEKYIYEANFPENSVNFDKFTNRLANLFEVDSSEISYTTQLVSFPNSIRQTVLATYAYNGKNRFRVGMFGFLADDQPCTWEESKWECQRYKIANADEWDEVIE
jgi:hypothetical protein